MSNPAWGGASLSREELRERKREALLRMAARMFAERGYEGTSLAQIADRLQVSKPTLYYYVRSKEDILNACVSEGVRAVRSFIAEANATGGSGLDKLRFYLRRHLAFLMDDFGSLLANCNLRSLSKKNRRDLAMADAAVEALLDEGIADGSVAPLDSKSCCFALLGAFNEIPRWYRPGSGKSLDSVVDEYLELFTEGLRPR